MSQTRKKAEEQEKARLAPWSGRGRIGQWVNLAISTVLAAGILVGLNLLARAHYIRKDLTSERSFELDDYTLKTLKNLDRDVTLYLVGPDPQQLKDRSLATVWQKIQTMCEEFKKRSPHIRIKIITEADTASLDRLKQHFKVPVSNSIYFVCHLGDDRYGLKALQVRPGRFYIGNPNTGKVNNFSGERWLVAGIRAVSINRKQIVYSVIGHDEATPQSGLALLKTFLEEREGVDLRPIVLRDVSKVPKDCECLLIAGPRHPLAPSEIQVLEEYLARGGRVFLALVPGVDAGLNDLFEEMGVKQGPGFICDVERFRGDLRYVLVRRFGSHAINTGLQNINSTFSLPFVSVVEKLEKPRPAWQVNYLFFSGPDAWEETGRKNQRRPRPTGKERRGSMPLGLTVVGPKDSRIVIWGSVNALYDTNFAYLGRPDIPNLEYLLNNFRWLMGREKDIPILPKRPGQRPMDLTPSALERIKWVTLLGFPGLGILVGLIAWFIRRK